MIRKGFRFLKLGIPLLDYFKFKNKNETGVFSTKLYGKKILINNPFWYLHSVEELFLEEVYEFSADNSAPYIIDCGANLGLSIIYFKKRFPNCKILAFEPDKNIFALLKKNLQAFNYKDLELINCAVWNENTVLNFSSDGALGGTISELGINKVSSTTVDAKSLKEFLELEQVDFLKIDIEGAEFEVLNACRFSLERVKKLFVEYHGGPKLPQMLPELLEIIKSAGFRFYIREAWKNMEHPFLDYQRERYYDLQLNIFCYR